MLWWERQLAGELGCEAGVEHRADASAALSEHFFHGQCSWHGRVCVSASKHETAPRKGACAAIAANYTIIPPDGPSPSASPALLWVES